MTTILPYADDQLIDATMAHALHTDACRDHALVAWVVLFDLPAYPERYAARLVTSGDPPFPYLLLADSLARGHGGMALDAAHTSTPSHRRRQRCANGNPRGNAVAQAHHGLTASSVGYYSQPAAAAGTEPLA